MAVREGTTGTTRDRTMLIWVVVLAVAVVGLAGWVVYDLFFSPTAAPTAELNQLMDDYTQAWNDHDGDAFLMFVTDDYTFDDGIGTTSTKGMQAQTIDDMAVFDWSVETIGDTIWAGDGPYYMTRANRITYTGQPDDLEGVSSFEVVEVDGEYLVAHHIYVGDTP